MNEKNISLVKSLCASEEIFQKGIELCESSQVLNFDRTVSARSKRIYVSGTVRSGQNLYGPWMIHDKEKGEISSYFCQCGTCGSRYGGMCVHCVALLCEYMNRFPWEWDDEEDFAVEVPGIEELLDSLPAEMQGRSQASGDAGEILSKWFDDYDMPGVSGEGREASAQRGRRKGPATDIRLKELIGRYEVRKRMADQTANGTMELIPTLEDRRQWNYYEDERCLRLSFRIENDEGKSYQIKNIRDFAAALQEEELYTHGKSISFVHSKCMFSEQAWKYCEIIMEAVSRPSPETTYAKEVPLYPDLLDRVMELCRGGEVTWRTDGHERKTVAVREENPPIQLTVQNESGRYFVKFSSCRILSGEKRDYVLMDDVCYFPSDEFNDDMQEWLYSIENNAAGRFRIAEEDLPAFFAAAVPILQKYNAVFYEGVSPEDFAPKEAEFSFYIDDMADLTSVICYVAYGEEKFNLLSQLPKGGEYRDLGRERRVLALVQAYFPEKNDVDGVMYFMSWEDDRMFRLLDTGIAQLSAEGSVYVSDRIRARRIIRNPRAQIGISVADGLLELSVTTEEFPREELAGVIESYRQKKKYHRLRDGSFLNIQQNAVSGIAEVLDGMALTDRQISGEIVEVPKYWAGYLDQSLKQSSGQLRVDRGRDYKSIIRQMNNIADSDYAVPPGLANILRGYQKIGYRWMRVLTDLGFGGILADDMGLGKTLQTIALLLARKQEGVLTGPSLVVCPASLIYNWQKEFQRFAPEMTVRVIAGSAPERAAMIHEQASADVWVTSYDMLKRDIEEYRDMAFDTEVIDESQNIKNQNTLAAKGVKQIRANTRFALTGTPIENRLSELWSCFDYLMPGILGTYPKFRKKYEIPIVSNQDKDTLDRLKRLVQPFILRRRKEDVLKELPEKLEQVVYSKMEGEQRRLYAAHALRLRDNLKNTSEESFRQDRIAVLAEITKLRQICCEPSLLFEDYQGLSCKMDTCMELVREAVDGKHKVLIFSQFTSLFPILEERLRAEEIAWYELTGKTPKMERLRLTEAFNTDEVPVFLISLKAGGTGLNLTGATIVIHFDPWWNLAAQNQATDRAHRIGQEEQVMVFKLIAQDTIEEKILALQEKKGQLASQVLEGETAGSGTLTREDIMEILQFDD